VWRSCGHGVAIHAVRGLRQYDSAQPSPRNSVFGDSPRVQRSTPQRPSERRRACALDRGWHGQRPRRASRPLRLGSCRLAESAIAPRRPRSPGQASIRPAEASIRPGFIDVVVTRDYLQRMRVVGIKQLKARLSEYLREVQRGTVFLVTDRDRVVAELRPPRSDRPPVGDELEQVFDALIEAGEVQAARARKAGWTWSPQGLGLESGRGYTVLEWVRADRGEPLP